MVGKMKTQRIQEIEELLYLLELFWKLHPDLRLGQIIDFLTNEIDMDQFYIADRVFISKLRNNIKL